MPKYTVEVELIAPVRRMIEIDAPAIDQAVGLALKQADNEPGNLFATVGKPLSWTIRSTKASLLAEKAA